MANRKQARLSLRTALVSASPLTSQVRAGLEALKADDRTLIAAQERAHVGDSLDLDEATKHVFPQTHRWDYLLSVPGRSQIVAIEPHSARDSQVSTVVAKKKGAAAFLRDHLAAPHRVSRWLWVSPGAVRFSRMERATRILDQHGIEFVGRKVTLL